MFFMRKILKSQPTICFSSRRISLNFWTLSRLRQSILFDFHVSQTPERIKIKRKSSQFSCFRPLRWENCSDCLIAAAPLLTSENGRFHEFKLLSPAGKCFNFNYFPLVLDWREKTKWWNSQQCDINHFNLRKCFTMFSSIHADTAAGDEMTSERVSESLSVASGRGRRGLRANDVTVKLVVRFSSRF